MAGLWASMNNFFYRIFRFFLFLLPPEWAHGIVLKMGNAPITKLFITPHRPVLEPAPIEMVSLHFPSYLGLAAGFDKKGNSWPLFAKLGFGHCELGTFTNVSQPGNPKPRLWRHAAQKGLQNKMGFNNPGLLAGLENIQIAAKNNKTQTPFVLGISISKGFATPLENAMDDVLKGIDSINQWTKPPSFEYYIALNISSPNTKGLRKLQSRKNIYNLVAQAKRESHLPLFIKFAPDAADEKFFLDSVAASIEGGASALILTNTSIDYSLIKNSRKAKVRGGGISGLPIQKIARQRLKSVRENFPQFPIISSGGINAPSEALYRLCLGANLVQVYTGLIYYGPAFVSNFENQFNQFLRLAQSQSIAAIPFKDRLRLFEHLG